MSERSMSALFKPVVLLPTYNNGQTLAGVLQRIVELKIPLIVVNDGSTDATPRILESWLASQSEVPVRVLTHPVNRGKAAALRTGFAHASAEGFTHAVTIDSDGQLDPEQIPELLAAAARQPEALILGVRDAIRADYPARSRWGRALSNGMIYLECGRHVSDSQCGFRVYPLDRLGSLRCNSGRFGYETEIITRAAWAGLPFAEVPVNCHYFPEEQRVTHFRPGRDTLAHLALHAKLLPGTLFSPLPATPAPHPAASRQEDRPRWFDWCLVSLIMVLGFALRVGYIFHYPFNSDEPQHLHVAWSWAHGMLQYRDVFDNHTPLFHILASLLVRWFGDRPDLLILMRLAMLPVFALTLWGVYRIGRTLFSPRLGLWATVLTGFSYYFFKGSIEFRTDDLWAMFFILSLAVLIGGRTTTVRAFTAGLLLGATLAVSMKTVLLLACLAGAGGATMLLYRRAFPGWRLTLRRGLPPLLGLATGLVVVPLFIVSWFYAHGALGNLYYGVIQHNLLSNMKEISPAAVITRRTGFFLIVAAIWIVAIRLAQRNPFGGATPAYLLLFFLAGFYNAAIRCLWPLVTAQDFLPIWPVLVLLAIPLLNRPLPDPGWLKGSLFRRLRLHPAFSMLLLFTLFNLTSLAMTQRWSDWHGSVDKKVNTWKTVLDLTDPNDFVLDPKGEMIFRQRSFYWGLEHITIIRMKRNLIPNTIVDSIIRTRTCVVYPVIDRYPYQTAKFIRQNFISVGSVLVAGQLLHPRGPQPVPFTITVPEKYTVISKEGSARGTLDGHPLDHSVSLAAGPHVYQPAPGEQDQELAVIWCKAAHRGYSPFHPNNKPFHPGRKHFQNAQH